MSGTACLVGILAIAAAPARKPTLPGPIFGSPPRVLAYQADVIFVGKITSLSSPRKIRVTLPGASKPVERFYSRSQALVSRVLKPPAAECGVKVRKGTRFRFEVLALYSGRGSKTSASAYRPALYQGMRHLLLLRRLPDSGRWILPYGNQHYPVPTADRLKAFTDALRLETWPWGPAKGGLQVAMICKWTQWSHMIRGRSTIFFRTFLALRNASRKPLTVNLRPDDAPLWIEARSATGQAVRADVYRSLKWRLKGEWPKPAEPIPPGQAIFVCTMGEGAIQVEATMDLAPGPWTVYAGYKNQRTQTEDGNTPLWGGEVVSQPLEIEVVPKDTTRR